MLAVPLAVLLTLVISAAPAAAEPRWKERCHFPGQPRMTVTFRPLQPSIGHTIQFGSEVHFPLTITPASALACADTSTRPTGTVVYSSSCLAQNPGAAQRV